VGGDRVYCFDGILPEFYDAWKRRGLVPDQQGLGYRALRCFDRTTGEQLWERTSDRVATWLAISPEHDVLIVSNKLGIDAMRAADGSSLWKKDSDAVGFQGHPEHLWDKVIVAGDQIIDQRGPGKAYDIRSGKPLMQMNPLSTRQEDWKFTRTGHHCNYAVGSPHLLTFRSDTAGFYDRTTGGTGRLQGFRAGCRNSLIPAGGVLNAPNYAHGCNCNYNLFTSLALVHRPDNDLWTYNAYAVPEEIVRIGVNLGAPGDRLDQDGTLWLEYPEHADPSPSVKITAEGELETFRVKTSRVTGNEAWIGASGVEGIRKIAITLRANETTPVKSRVRLIFLEPDARAGAEPRRFDVLVQGVPRIQRLDVRQAAGAPLRVWSEELSDVEIVDSLHIEFRPLQREPVLCGVMIDSSPPTGD